MSDKYKGSRDDHYDILEMIRSQGRLFLVAFSEPDTTTSFAYTNIEKYSDMEEILKTIKKLHDETIFIGGTSDE